jgi:hypothetical protein
MAYARHPVDTPVRLFIGALWVAVLIVGLAAVVFQGFIPIIFGVLVGGAIGVTISTVSLAMFYAMRRPR